MAKQQKKTYSFHAYSEFFPLLEGDDLEALVLDIQEHGQIHPIILYKGSILDGRNRFRACQIAGVTPRFEEFKGTEAEALDYATSLNLTRRHLTTAQRAILAVQLLPHEKEKALRRMKSGTENPPQNFAEGSDKGEAIQIAGKKVGVSSETIRQAKNIAETAPDVVKAVVSGVVKSMPEALRLSKLDKRTRTRTIRIASQKGIRISKALQEVQPEQKGVSPKVIKILEWSKLHGQISGLSLDKNISSEMLKATRNTLEDEINHRMFTTINGFVPYTGGKTRGIKDILVLINAIIRESGLGFDFEFREPFIGGGSVSINVLKNGIAPKVRLSDLNFPLVAYITAVIQDPKPLMDYISSYELTKETADEMYFLLVDEDKKYKYFDQIVNEIVEEELDEDDLKKPLFEIPQLIPYLSKLAFAKFMVQKTGPNGFGEFGGKPTKRWIKDRWKPDNFCDHITVLNDLVYDRVVGNRCHLESYKDAIDRPNSCFIFADPPYVADGTRKKFYPNEFTEDDHFLLRDMLEETRHPFLLTYGDDKDGMIRNLYSNSNWFYMQPVNRMSGKKWIKELWIVPAHFKSVMIHTRFEKVQKLPIIKS